MLFIKSLILNGFKAFGEKTELVFSEGIGALVGPNGCGKSNVIDAIKWVVGEQKISELRGDRLEDLIFNGSETLKASNYAEVELILDNNSKILPIVSEEVSIVRRLYRSGETECLINKQFCRLKDIQSLFFDTGIGKSTYSIIAQGKIDRIFSENNEERRKIFEEAASISKYLEKQREYERKIEKANNNLLRLSDLLKELEKRNKQLEKQAKDSDRFFELQSKLKEKEVDGLLYRIIQIKKKQENNREQIEINERSLTIWKQEMEDFRENLIVFRSDISEKEEFINELEKQKIRIEEEISFYFKQVESYKNREKESKRSIELQENNLLHFEEELEEINERLKKLEKEMEESKELLKVIDFEKKLLLEEEKEIKERIEKLLLEKKNNVERLQDFKTNKRIKLEEQEKLIKEIVKEIDEIKHQVREERNDFLQKGKELFYFQKELLKSIYIVLNKEVEVKELEKIKEKVKKYEGLFEEYIKNKDSFYELIFSTESSYSNKVKIDKKIEGIEKEIERIEKRENEIIYEVEGLRKGENKVEQEKSNIEIKKVKYEQFYVSVGSELKEKKKRKEILESLKAKTFKEINLLKESYKEVKEKERNLKEKFLKNEKEIKRIKEILRRSFSKVGEKNKKIQVFLKRSQELEKKINNRKKDLDNLLLNERLFEKDLTNFYEIGLEQFSVDIKGGKDSLLNKGLNLEEIKEKIEWYKEKLKELGKINPLAKEEYEELEKELEEIKKQREDVEKSLEDLKAISLEIERTSRETFLEQFSLIKDNFYRLFRRLFNGGRADIRLKNEAEPLKSDVEINVQPPGKKMQKISLFSGGEKSLIAISIMFSIFLTKPSPICLLDEVDAALDAENVKRLSKLFEEFKETTQFLVISHNQKTMDIIDYIYGITMRTGISKIFSIKMENYNI